MSLEQTPQTYDAWLASIEDHGTPPLADYLAWVGYDVNLPWRLGVAHLVNLLDAAVEALEAAYGTTNALRDVLEASLGTTDEGEKA